MKWELIQFTAAPTFWIFRQDSRKEPAEMKVIKNEQRIIKNYPLKVCTYFFYTIPPAIWNFNMK